MNPGIERSAIDILILYKLTAKSQVLNSRVKTNALHDE